METAGETFTAENRADLAISVIVHDANDEPVFEGTFDYALRSRKT